MFSGLILFISCEKDPLFEDSKSDEFYSPSLRLLDQKDIYKNAFLYQELQKLDAPPRTTTSNSNNNDPDTYYNLNSFKVLSDLAKEITSQQHVTYTFNLKSKDPNLSSPKLFNLIFIEHNSGQEPISKVLTVYHFSEDQRFQFDRDLPITGTFFISFHHIDENDNIYPPIKTNGDPSLDGQGNGNGNGNQTYPGYWIDEDGWYHFFEEGEGFYGGSLSEVLIQVWTFPKWGGSDSYEDENGTPPGWDPDLPDRDGGSGGFTSPVTVETDPCKKLDVQFDSQNLKNELKNLYKQRNSSTEHGFSENKDGTFNAGTNSTNTSIEIDVNSNTVGYAHTHPFTPMFSPTDLERFWNIIRNTYNDGRNTGDAYGIMISSEGNYILRFTGNYASDYGIFNGSRPTGKDMEKKYNDMFDRNDENLEKTFFSYIETYMLNNNAKFSDFFEMYQFDLDEDGEMTNLTKKELDGDQIKSKPCE